MEVPPDQIGDQLRDARERAGLTAADVNFKTRLPLSVIAALEAGEFSEFASPTYAKSFLAQYSAFLNVDAKPWLDALEPADFVTAAFGRPVWEAPKPIRELQVQPRVSSSGWASALSVLAASAGLLYGAMKGYEYLENRFDTEPKPASEALRDKSADDSMQHVDRTMSAAVETKGISETPVLEPSEPTPRAIIVR